MNKNQFEVAKKLSPRRNSSEAGSIQELALEQLKHFSIDPEGDLGSSLIKMTEKIYECDVQRDEAWNIAQKYLHKLDHKDRVALFNAKKFISFQLAKVLDNFQQSFRKSYQNLEYSQSTVTSKSAYPLFDNVISIFSATPVITRTATYIFACAEWVNDAFEGKEFMLDIYSRLLNPTSISLANHIVDLEAGPYSGEYLAWNFNSGMAAIDSTLSHLLGYEDILITNRNIYGGTHQLLYDWYAKPSNLNISVVSFGGCSVESFLDCLEKTKETYKDKLSKDNDVPKRIYLLLESPCNPHGSVLDVPAICKAAHQNDITVMLDSTVATPFLYRPLQRKDVEERPDYVIHSYTKDLTGTGSVIAGCVIGKNENMFIPKGMPGWDNTMFWNVYYIKGAFLNADAAFEVLQGTRTLELRMLNKCINTIIISKFFSSHPQYDVTCSFLEESGCKEQNDELMYLGLPAPLFTFTVKDVENDIFQQFFDCLSPMYGHMISLGQTNTIVSCPGLTTHSELSEEHQREVGIYPTTIRIAVGNENPMDLIKHMVNACRLTFDQAYPGFSSKFMNMEDAQKLIEDVYVETHAKHIKAILD